MGATAIMTECQRCGGKAVTFLCRKCEVLIAQMLAELPWWLDRLTETACGQTRMSDNGGRRSAPRKGISGETPIAACIEPFPNSQETDLDRARRQRAKAALAHALAAGGVNARASELLAEIADSLQYWVKELCDARGAAYVRPGRTKWTALGSEYAIWLRINVAAISGSEYASDITGDIEGHLDDIVAAVNRPMPVRDLGRCPTWVENGPTDLAGDYCGRPLRAPVDAVEIHCRSCKATHNVNRLLLEMMNEAERTTLTFAKLCQVNRMQADGFQIPLRTLQKWRKDGTLRPRGWLRPDGHRGIAKHGDADQPLYLWSDVRTLRVKRPQKALTGAAAHRRGE